MPDPEVESPDSSIAERIAIADLRTDPPLTFHAFVQQGNNLLGLIDELRTRPPAPSMPPARISVPERTLKIFVAAFSGGAVLGEVHRLIAAGTLDVRIRDDIPRQAPDLIWLGSNDEVEVSPGANGPYRIESGGKWVSRAQDTPVIRKAEELSHAANPGVGIVPALPVIPRTQPTTTSTGPVFRPRQRSTLKVPSAGVDAGSVESDPSSINVDLELVCARLRISKSGIAKRLSLSNSAVEEMLRTGTGSEEDMARLHDLIAASKPSERNVGKVTDTAIREVDLKTCAGFGEALETVLGPDAVAELSERLGCSEDQVIHDLAVNRPVHWTTLDNLLRRFKVHSGTRSESTLYLMLGSELERALPRTGSISRIPPMQISRTLTRPTNFYAHTKTALAGFLRLLETVPATTDLSPVCVLFPSSLLPEAGLPPGSMAAQLKQQLSALASGRGLRTRITEYGFGQQLPSMFAPRGSRAGVAHTADGRDAIAFLQVDSPRAKAVYQWTMGLIVEQSHPVDSFEHGPRRQPSPPLETATLDLDCLEPSPLSLPIAPT